MSVVIGTFLPAIITRFGCVIWLRSARKDYEKDEKGPLNYVT